MESEAAESTEEGAGAVMGVKTGSEGGGGGETEDLCSSESTGRGELLTLSPPPPLFPLSEFLFCDFSFGCLIVLSIGIALGGVTMIVGICDGMNELTGSFEPPS